MSQTAHHLENGSASASENGVDRLAAADAAKTEANAHFKDHEYTEAVEGYTKAIALNPTNAVYYANRAAAHIHLENFGCALTDASKAIELDPKYTKVKLCSDVWSAAVPPNTQAGGRPEHRNMPNDFEDEPHVTVAHHAKRCRSDSQPVSPLWSGLEGRFTSRPGRKDRQGIYRRADANVGLGRMKKALIDYKRAAQVNPRDPDLRKKLTQCDKEVKRIRFEEAVATPDELPAAEELDLSSMPVDDSYDGPTMEGSEESGYTLTRDFVIAMIEHFKAQKLIHRRFAFQILLQARDILRELPSLVDVSIPHDQHMTVCGDTHGQFYDLCNIFDLNGLPSDETPYLFNGDFVDRGSFSLEVILTLMAFKVLYPRHMHLARGNHESQSMNKVYGFDGEVKHKYNGLMADIFKETFCWLPLGHVLNRRVLVVHGGLFSRDGVKLDDIRAVNRYREPPEEGLMCELLWSDPGPSNGRTPSKRGVGVAFGADVTQRFLQDNGLELLVRSHEVKDEGYEVEHNGYCVTVFSAPNYCDQMNNKGAWIRFNGKDMSPQFTQFEAVPHPDVKAMAYAGNFYSSMLGM